VGQGFAPTTIGVMVWATEFLHQGRNLSPSEAATDASLVPIGWIIGCPLLGYISDRIGRRKPVLLLGAACLLVGLVAAVFIPGGFALRYTIALAIGVASGAAMIPFTVVKEVNPDNVKGSAAGAMNFLCFMVTGLLARAFERFLRLAKTVNEFQHGLTPLIYGVGVGILLSFFLRETGLAVRQQHPSVSPRATRLDNKPTFPVPSTAS
jgi:sugar phosphate permease